MIIIVPLDVDDVDHLLSQEQLGDLLPAHGPGPAVSHGGRVLLLLQSPPGEVQPVLQVLLGHQLQVHLADLHRHR